MWGFIKLEIWNCKDTKDFEENQKSLILIGLCGLQHVLDIVQLGYYAQNLFMENNL